MELWRVLGSLSSAGGGLCQIDDIADITSASVS